MNAQQVDDLMGCEYKAGSFGPPSSGFNCWGLLLYVQREYFGVTMPVAPIGDNDGCVAMVHDLLQREVWALTDTPKHGDGALMRGGNNPHVGIYLDFDGGGILHALEGVGVVFTTLGTLNYYGFGRTKFYRLTNDSESSYSS